jgi:thiol-disulfide isomerase/thioredoxin
MTGNDETDTAARERQGGGNWALYIPVAVFAAIAGFLSISLADLIGRYEPGQDAMPRQAAAPQPGPSGKGLEKLVRSDSPKPLPEIRFSDGDGREVTLAGMRGKTLLVNLWATWCAPCKVEIPGLNRLQARLGGQDFEVVAISLDWAGAEKPRQFLESNGLDKLALYFDTKKDLMQRFGAPGLPLSVLIDEQGREAARLAGSAEWDSPEAETLIREIIAGTQKK